MSDISRHARRSTSPELLGLSMLDTVTCALGGAIILMILMTSVIEPGAQVEITEYRRIHQAGAGTPGPPASDAGEGIDSGQGQASKLSNLATLFLDFEGAGVSTKDLRPGLSQSKECEDATVSILKPPEGHYPGEQGERRWALVVWAESSCKSFTLDLELESVPQACTATLVSGAHFEVKSFRPCRPHFELRGRGKQVVSFRRAP